MVPDNLIGELRVLERKKTIKDIQNFLWNDFIVDVNLSKSNFVNQHPKGKS